MNTILLIIIMRQMRVDRYTLFSQCMYIPNIGWLNFFMGIISVGD